MRRSILTFFLTLVSLCFALVIAEVVCKVLGIISFNDLPQRYLTEGVRTFVPGFYTLSEKYPIENKKDISVLWADLYAYPKEELVTTDEYGFRSRYLRDRNPSTLIVGDSVVFGYGAPVEETLPFALDATNRFNGVYPLAVSGWGPASYMKSVDDYLRNSSLDNNSISAIIIVYFLGNDDINLKRSCWPEQDLSLPPTQFILRNDMPQYAVYAPPNFLVTSILRKSSLAFLVYSAIYNKPVDILTKKEERSEPKEKLVDDAVSMLHLLKRAYCVDGDDRRDIEIILGLLEVEDFEQAHRIAIKLARNLISNSCAPLHMSDVLGHKANMTFRALYHVSRLLHGSKMNIADAEYCGEESSLTVKKREIFKEWLNKKSAEYDVRVFLLPAEYQISRYNVTTIHWLCEGDISDSFRCTNLAPQLKTLYENSKDALYLDGSHLNKDGVRRVTTLIEKSY